MMIVESLPGTSIFFPDELQLVKDKLHVKAKRKIKTGLQVLCIQSLSRNFNKDFEIVAI